MTQDSDRPTARHRTSSNDLAATCFIHKLPPELLTIILELLDVFSLRRAAAVSRIFYLSAWSAGLYLSGSIICNPLGDSEFKAAVLDDIVQHALVNGRRLHLSLEFIVHDEPPVPDVQRILCCVIKSLPALIYLSVSLGPRLFPSLLTALHDPAPDLRELVIHVDRHAGPSRPKIPVDIFSGAAPNLRVLELGGLSLCPGSVPAFSHLTSVHLCYSNWFPRIKYAFHFPQVRFLRLSYFAQPGIPPPGPFDLAGLRLRKLAIAGAGQCPLIFAVSPWIYTSHIPVFEYIGGRLPENDPLWQEDIGPVSIRLARDVIKESGVRIQVVPVHRRWRRTYHVGSGHPDAPCPICALARLQLGQWLTYLRMDNEHLIALLEANWPVLAALCDMRIDFDSDGPRAAMVWPPDWSHTLRRATCAFGPDDVSTQTFALESYRHLQCPALKTLALCHCPSDTAMAIESRELAFLGRALGQCARPVQDRAALMLVGIQFKLPVAHDLLGQTFSCIHNHSLFGIGPIWERDDGVWDEEV